MNAHSVRQNNFFLDTTKRQVFFSFFEKLEELVYWMMCKENVEAFTICRIREQGSKGHLLQFFYLSL